MMNRTFPAVLLGYAIERQPRGGHNATLIYPTDQHKETRSGKFIEVATSKCKDDSVSRQASQLHIYHPISILDLGYFNIYTGI
jgi:hypothetical protein